jgi:Rad3-related DNA helicase
LVSRIQSFLAEQPGKSLVFVPSYAVLNEVARRMPHQDLLSGPLQVQPKGLQEDGVEAFLAPFRNQPGPVTGLAVLGGPLNEGIDLAGDALTTVVVVSIGLPALCRERELLREWFQSQGEEGFLLAYSLPGLNRVRQAVGRILRGPEDRGRVLLVDSRFDHPLYRTYF